MPQRRTTLSVLAGAALLALGAGFGPAAQAQGFPSKTIKFVVPFGPGSGTDTSARYFARKLQDLTGQPVVVENKPGANGFLAVKQVLQALSEAWRERLFVWMAHNAANRTEVFHLPPERTVVMGANLDL